MTQYETTSEIIDPETGEPHRPLEDWDIEVLERGLSENLEDLGGRKPFVANARVRGTEPSGKSWVALTRRKSQQRDPLLTLGRPHRLARPQIARA